mgnify:CR=1 FL=1
MVDIPKPKYPGGRPSKYDPAFCYKVIKWGKQGKSRTWICAALDITKPTMRAWEADHSEFSSAMGKAGVYAQSVWEDRGEAGMTAKQFNASVWSRSMAARFPDEWRENSNVNLGGQANNPVVITGIDVSILGTPPKS